MNAPLALVTMNISSSLRPCHEGHIALLPTSATSVTSSNVAAARRLPFAVEGANMPQTLSVTLP